MTELLKYLHILNAASVQVTMAELPTQFQCQTPVLSPETNRCDFQICR